jgi:hypothetical protein
MVSVVCEADATRDQLAIRQRATQSEQQRHDEFDLVSITVSRDARIGNRDRRFRAGGLRVSLV